MWTHVEPLVDAPAPAAYWESWTPKIGDRVRVRLNGECRVDWRSHDVQMTSKGLVQGHQLVEDGRLGTVSDCGEGFPCPHTKPMGHEYGIEYDTPMDALGIVWAGGHYAAGELERVP